METELSGWHIVVANTYGTDIGSLTAFYKELFTTSSEGINMS